MGAVMVLQGAAEITEVSTEDYVMMRETDGLKSQVERNGIDWIIRHSDNFVRVGLS